MSEKTSVMYQEIDLFLLDKDCWVPKMLIFTFDSEIILISVSSFLHTNVNVFIDQLQLNRGDWLKLLQLRAQQQSTSDNKMVQCLWCQENYHRSSPLLTWDSLAGRSLCKVSGLIQ